MEQKRARAKAGENILRPLQGKAEKEVAATSSAKGPGKAAMAKAGVKAREARYPKWMMLAGIMLVLPLPNGTGPCQGTRVTTGERLQLTRQVGRSHRMHRRNRHLPRSLG